MSNLEFCSDQASHQGHWEEGVTPSKGGSQLRKQGVGLLNSGASPGERQSGPGTRGTLACLTPGMGQTADSSEKHVFRKKQGHKK